MARQGGVLWGGVEVVMGGYGGENGLVWGAEERQRGICVRV